MLNHHAELISRRRELLAEIRTLSMRVPKSYADWHHGRSVEFKTTCRKAQALLNKSGATTQELESMLGLLRGFHS